VRGDDHAHYAHDQSDFVVTGPDVEPVKFKSRREARDWCAKNHPGSPNEEIGPGGKRAAKQRPKTERGRLSDAWQVGAGIGSGSWREWRGARQTSRRAPIPAPYSAGTKPQNLGGSGPKQKPRPGGPDGV
jgi:hypothetical protein